jgi:hypothetical protein
MRSTGLAVLVLLAVWTAGCHKRAPKIVALPPTPPPSVVSPPVTPTPVTIPPVAPPVELPSPAIAFLDEGDRAFIAGSYDQAARAYENYLQVAPNGASRDYVLFRLGLSYASRSGPTDWQRAMTTLKLLVEQYPDSPLKVPANFIVSLRTDLDQASGDIKQRDQKIKQLTTELDRLRKIDTDRRKRP